MKNHWSRKQRAFKKGSLQGSTECRDQWAAGEFPCSWKPLLGRTAWIFSQLRKSFSLLRQSQRNSGFLLVAALSRLDFHLWQFFAACLPPFAVYLTAQYARYEMRRLEKQREQAENLLLHTVVAEEVASRLADGGDNAAPEESDKLASSSKGMPQKEDVMKAESKVAAVQVPLEDLQQMKKRLEALERKLSTLEGASKETGLETTTKSQPTSVIRPESISPNMSTQYEPKIQGTGQRTVSSAEPERRQQTTVS
ncbi:hypothetical protein R1flu_006337 [Riccia fluitans]|uniref:Peroxin-14 n=1 Tax=Riccia fluitans TaxID=41844 RepID=A0ABD1YVX6_9MARC